MCITRNNRFLRIYLFVAIYSNALRIILGKWGTLIADALMIIILFYVIFIENKGKIYFNKKVKTIFVSILLLQTISIIEVFNSNIGNSLYALIEFRKSVFQLICFLLAYYCADHTKFWENIEFVEWLVFPTILYGIKQALFFSSIDSVFYTLQDAALDTLQYGGTQRAISIYSGPFHFGMMCSLMLCVSLALLYKTKKKKHILIIIACLIGAYCSITRTNIVCCIVILCIFIYGKLMERNTIYTIFQKTLVFFVVTLICIWFVTEFTSLVQDNNGFATLINSVFNMESDNRFIGRIDTWEIAINMIKKHPIIGYGVGSAGDTLAYYSVAFQYVTPHNMFIKLFVETGIIGLVLLIIILINLFKQCIIETKGIKRYFYLSCFAVVLLNALVGSTISTFPIMSIFWIFVGMKRSENR